MKLGPERAAVEKIEGDGVQFRCDTAVKALRLIFGWESGQNHVLFFPNVKVSVVGGLLLNTAVSQAIKPLPFPIRSLARLLFAKDNSVRCVVSANQSWADKFKFIDSDATWIIRGEK